MSKAQPKKPGEDGNAKFPEPVGVSAEFRPAGEAIRSFRECRDCKASENVTLAQQCLL